MRKYGYIHFYGNDTSYFFITGGFLNDVYGHFYLNYEIDSIEMKKITSKHDAYNYQKMKGETSWYEFGPVLPKYD